MDAQRFDHFARVLAVGSSRRGALKALIGTAVAGWTRQLQINRARAQCSWTGTFQATLGNISTMTVTETAGQVSGGYTFTDNGVAVEGTLSGVVRTNTPGFTVLDGSWREPLEGGRLWFAMDETCTQFTGWYTSSDASTEWIAGWDGVRIDDGQPPTGTEAATYFINPGDTRAAQITMDGQTGTFFGPKDPDGGVQYINQALISSADGDPEKEVLFEFDTSGAPTRATLARGDSMAFEWLSPTNVIVTYVTADGSQEVRFPYEAAPSARRGLPRHARHHGSGGEAPAEGRWLAYTGVPNPSQALSKPRRALAAAQAAMSSPGELQVQCQSGDLIGGATVTGRVVPANAPGTPLHVSFTESSTGRFEYSLPIAPAPPPGEGFHRTRFQRALTIICLGNTAMLLTQASKGFICAWLLGIPAAGTVGFAACEVILTGYIWACRANFAATVGGVAVDFFAGTFQVTARVQHPKFGATEATFTVSAGERIPTQVVQFPGSAAIAGVTIETASGDADPEPGESYTIRAATACVPTGTLLTINMIGSDEFPSSTSVTITEDVTEATLTIPGASQGVYDTITVTLSGPAVAADETTIVVTF